MANTDFNLNNAFNSAGSSLVELVTAKKPSPSVQAYREANPVSSFLFDMAITTIPISAMAVVAAPATAVLTTANVGMKVNKAVKGYRALAGVNKPVAVTRGGKIAQAGRRGAVAGLATEAVFAGTKQVSRSFIDEDKQKSYETQLFEHAFGVGLGSIGFAGIEAIKQSLGKSDTLKNKIGNLLAKSYEEEQTFAQALPDINKAIEEHSINIQGYNKSLAFAKTKQEKSDYDKLLASEQKQLNTYLEVKSKILQVQEESGNFYQSTAATRLNSQLGNVPEISKVMKNSEGTVFTTSAQHPIQNIFATLQVDRNVRKAFKGSDNTPTFKATIDGEEKEIAVDIVKSIYKTKDKTNKEYYMVRLHDGASEIEGSLLRDKAEIKAKDEIFQPATFTKNKSDIILSFKDIESLHKAFEDIPSVLNKIPEPEVVNSQISLDQIQHRSALARFIEKELVVPETKGKEVGGSTALHLLTPTAFLGRYDSQLRGVAGALLNIGARKAKEQDILLNGVKVDPREFGPAVANLVKKQERKGGIISDISKSDNNSLPLVWSTVQRAVLSKEGDSLHTTLRDRLLEANKDIRHLTDEERILEKIAILREQTPVSKSINDTFDSIVAFLNKMSVIRESSLESIRKDSSTLMSGYEDFNNAFGIKELGIKNIRKKEDLEIIAKRAVAGILQDKYSLAFNKSTAGLKAVYRITDPQAYKALLTLEEKLGGTYEGVGTNIDKFIVKTTNGYIQPKKVVAGLAQWDSGMRFSLNPVWLISNYSSMLTQTYPRIISELAIKSAGGAKYGFNPEVASRATYTAFASLTKALKVVGSKSGFKQLTKEEQDLLIDLKDGGGLTQSATDASGDDIVVFNEMFKRYKDDANIQNFLEGIMNTVSIQLQISEPLPRIHAALTYSANKHILNPGATREQHARAAEKFIARAIFNHNNLSKASAFTTGSASFFGYMKTWALNYISSFIDDTRIAFDNKDFTALATRILIGQSIAGFAGSIPGYDVFNWYSRVITGDNIETIVRNAWGNNRTTDFLFYGLPGLLGYSINYRLDSPLGGFNDIQFIAQAFLYEETKKSAKAFINIVDKKAKGYEVTSTDWIEGTSFMMPKIIQKVLLNTGAVVSSKAHASQRGGFYRSVNSKALAYDVPLVDRILGSLDIYSNELKQLANVKHEFTRDAIKSDEQYASLRGILSNALLNDDEYVRNHVIDMANVLLPAHQFRTFIRSQRSIHSSAPELFLSYDNSYPTSRGVSRSLEDSTRDLLR